MWVFTSEWATRWLGGPTSIRSPFGAWFALIEPHDEGICMKLAGWHFSSFVGLSLPHRAKNDLQTMSENERNQYVKRLDNPYDSADQNRTAPQAGDEARSGMG